MAILKSNQEEYKMPNQSNELDQAITSLEDMSYNDESGQYSIELDGGLILTVTGDSNKEDLIESYPENGNEIHLGRGWGVSQIIDQINHIAKKVENQENV